VIQRQIIYSVLNPQFDAAATVMNKLLGPQGAC
jgi:hypothetical protein